VSAFAAAVTRDRANVLATAPAILRERRFINHIDQDAGILYIYEHFSFISNNQVTKSHPRE